MRRRLLLAVPAFAMFAAASASCLSPTLPLPPPDHPDIILEDSAGLWQIAGQCDIGAFVTVFNATLGRGVLVQDRDLAGTYHVALPGSPCDVAWISQESADGQSGQTTFVLTNYSDGAPDDPNACK